MNQGDNTWAKGWRIVLTCTSCKVSIWSKNVGQRVTCDCDPPKYLMDGPHNFNHSFKDNYDLILKRVENPY